jgi:hypothetical protein
MPDVLAACPECERRFPADLLHPMQTSEGHLARVCPLCALTLRNVMHGLPKDTPFHGSEAKRMWRRAAAWVKANSG